MRRRRKPSCLVALILATLSLALPASAVSATKTYVAVNVHCDIATFKLGGLDPATVRAARVTLGRRAARVKPAVVRRAARRGTLRLRLSTLPWRGARTRAHQRRTGKRRHGARATRRGCRNTRARQAQVRRRKRPNLTVTTTDPAPPPPAPSGFPASFFTGPLGAANIVPGRTTGALLGTWLPGVPGWSWDQVRQLFLDRQAYIGRKYDIAHVHYGAPLGKCYSVAPLSDARAKWSADSGYTLVLSWTPGWKLSEVNAGLADACLAEVGARFAAWNKPVLLRIYWEFNGDWMNWSGSGETFINAWKRTVTKIRAAGGTNVGFLWSPASGYRDRAFASYPGDDWVDWVGISAYNRNKAGVWCSPYDSGPWCELPHLLTQDPVNAPTVYDVYSQRKPFMVAETGSVEDTATPGRKGQWLRNAAAKIPADVSNVRGLTYSDFDATATENVNWRLDTSQSSLDGFRTLALDPFFNTR
jgi:hypothetical protein